MKTTGYLYGFSAKELKNKFYEEALRYKLEKGLIHYRKLYDKTEKTKEEQDQMFWIEKALDHTRKLLEELEN